MERSRDADRRKKETERLRRAAARARCMVCSEPVSVEDRCSDGNYLHRDCARGMSERMVKRA